MQPPAPVMTHIAPPATAPPVRDDEEVEWMGYESAYPLPTILGMRWVNDDAQKDAHR